MNKKRLYFLTVIWCFLAAVYAVQHYTGQTPHAENLPSDLDRSMFFDADQKDEKIKASKTDESAASCTAFTPPFWEGFNIDSPTINCWKIVDNNNDATTLTGSNIWKQFTSTPYEGDQTMLFQGVQVDTSKIPHDDWLISPAFKLDAAKVYQLRYFYKTQSYAADFKVLLSQSGTTLSGFTTTLLTKKSYNNAVWEEETMLIGGISGDIHLAWQVTTAVARSYMFLDQVTLVEVDCAYPEELDVKGVKADQATIVWKDDFNTGWEYIVQKEGEGYPSGTGTSSSTREVTITTDKSGTNLTDNTGYEFYVRSKCSNGNYSDWIGPFVFRTTCRAFTPPFVEGFNTTSSTINCWTILDADGDAGDISGQPLNIWGVRIHSVLSYEGDASIYYRGTGVNTTHDDWLISPAIAMTGGIYAVSYYFRTHPQYPSDDREFEVLLSENGTDISNFTTVLLPKKKYEQGNYKKQTLYVQGIDGEVNIAWHVTSQSGGIMHIDMVTIEAVDCIGIKDDVVVSDIRPDQATFTWQDNINTQWEYYVKTSSGTKPPTPPTGSGTKTSSKSVTVSQTATGTGLQPDTEYEFWVRSNCGNGSGLWVLAIFKTLCGNPMPFPFWEGFNTDSSTVSCWTIIDGNGDADDISGGGVNRWNILGSFYEGDRGATFAGNGVTILGKEHDDWLISPTFILDSTKYYRLKYHYQTSLNYRNEFALLLSTKGVDPVNFTHELISKQGYSDDNWNERTVIFSGNGLAGEVNIGWHLTTKELTTGRVTIDNVFFEEVDCPEPFDLQTKDEKEDSAVLSWTEDLGANWEYIVQKSDGSVPAGSGMKSAVKEVTVTTDKDGQALEPNTEYEFYVRTDCGNGKYSTWTGPYPFRTACKVFDTPFWEGFNIGTPNIPCWTIVNANDDFTRAFMYQNFWNIHSYTTYEGSGSMRFYGATTTDKLPHNDWLISPAIKFEVGKTYRLKYHYRTKQQTLLTTSQMNSEFEVLLSDSGQDIDQFMTTVISRKKYSYPGEDWQEEYVFISGVSGEVNIAWHTVSNDNSLILYVDNVFVEEIQGCPEPLPVTLGVRDEQSNRAAIFWKDDRGGTQWEYYIQEDGNGIPTGMGTQTNTKENIITKEQSGKALEPNTTYEFYVRTVCGNGEYSIWSGPYAFTTLCGDTYTTPFWEGFNTDSKTIKCWEIRDENKDSPYPGGVGIWRQNASLYPQEGDKSMEFNGADTLHNDWLISPKIEMETGMYVLKYYYRSYSKSITADFEVLLSTNYMGTGTFTQTIVPHNTYSNESWEEKVVFFNSVKADANLAWHVLKNGRTGSFIDNVLLKKVESCPEPYYVIVTNQTLNSIDIEWQQEGGITTWEVLVVDYGKDETATPIQIVTVTGSPKTTITGLDEGKVYIIYVRAKCTDDTANSDWSTPLHSGTVVSNDDCDSAIEIPVNTGNTCDKEIEVSFIGATESVVPKPVCVPNIGEVKDIWFEFTAISDKHALEMKEGYSKSNFSYVYASVYEQPCNTMVVEKQCFYIFNDSNIVWLENLVPGQKYYIRLAATLTDDIFDFKLCLTTPKYLEISPQDERYTLEELVKNVLITTDSECDLVSAISYQNADGNPQAMTDKTIGYFNKNGVDFPFEDGIVLTTTEVKHVPGPYQRGGAPRSRYAWKGDKDVNDAVAKAGQEVRDGSMKDTRRTTQLEFDFIPILDSVSFEYLFASNHYTNNCTYRCEASAVFVAWLTDTKTQGKQNLAEIPDTDVPIAINTIHDSNKIGFSSTYSSECDSSYPELYWKSYHSLQDRPDLGVHGATKAPFNFAGSTIALLSKKTAVIPGRKYHLKLLVIDACGLHSSAVFINAKSLDLGAMGDINLGEDLLVSTNTALCKGESAVIQTGVAASEELAMETEWYKDDVLIPGANTPDLEVSEAGEYKVVMKFTELNCEFTDSIKVEVYPPISDTVHQAEDIVVCRQSLEELEIDLTSVEIAMFKDTDRSIYITGYYKNAEDAEASENAISNIENYALGKVPKDQTLYIRIENMVTGCHEVFELHIQPKEGAVLDSLENVRVCAEYIFPVTANNQYYYTEPGGAGKVYKTGDVLAEPGEHTIYLLQVNSEEGCYEETAYQVNITAPVTADVFEDKTLSCEYYELKPLSEYNNYYTEPEGQGTELYEGMQILQGQTIYVYASSEDGLCADENSFTIDYEDCPIPRGISPNNDGLNDVFDLTPHGVESLKIYSRWGTEVYAHGEGYTTQWHGQSKSGKQLPDGTYYYVIRAHGKIRTGWVQINK